MLDINNVLASCLHNTYLFGLLLELYTSEKNNTGGTDSYDIVMPFAAYFQFVYVCFFCLHTVFTTTIYNIRYLDKQANHHIQCPAIKISVVL